MLTILILFSFLLFIEVFAYLAIRFLLKGKEKPFSLAMKALYWLWTFTVSGLIIYCLLNREKFSAPGAMNFAFVVVGLGFMNFSAKAILAFSHLVNLVTNWLFHKMNSKESSSSQSVGMSRSKFITTTGLALASIPFGGLLYGMVTGRFQFRVLRQPMKLANLPKAFEGLKIVHLSDMHLGSFPHDTDAVAQAVEMVNQLEPDYIFFTGDMINERAIEAEHWIGTIKKLKAKYGKYSSLGNHDYGSYYGPWAGDEQKIQENLVELQKIQEKMGFQLLRNENVKLVQGEESIRLIGLENWGVGFVQAGDMNKAFAGVSDDEVQILLSHDPTHWDEQVLGKTSVDLSLAGHTHGSQMGVEIPALGIKISPVSLRYKRWGGLYQEGKQQLYVNRGFGYIGYAGRVGMNPEITLFTLERG